MSKSMLWKLVNVGPHAITSDSDFAAALRQHLHYTPNGLVAVLLQIKEEQSAYVLQAGCAGCAIDRCVPGCRVALLRRVLGVGYPDSQLVLVKNGLLERPYTRTVIAWPSDDDAEALDQSVLAGWTDARLQVHWRSTEWYQSLRWRSTGHQKPQLAASALLRVGDGGDDPLERLRDRGWKGHRMSEALPCLRGQPRSAPFWARRSTTLEPHLLTPIVPAHGRARPRARSMADATSEVDVTHAASYGNAATIAQHLAEAGARIELLDLDQDGWTAQVVATTATGDDIGPILEALEVPGAPLVVHDAGAGSVALDPAQARPTEDVPPLLFLGTCPDGRQRWRPMSATHHLVLAGTIEDGVVAGMLAPALQSRRDLRIGVLDLTGEGLFNLGLQNLPQRLPTTDGRSCAELLGVIGGLADGEQPILVVLGADTIEDAQRTLVALLRAAMYRPISVVLVVPDVVAIPPLIQNRCPLVAVRERVARVHAPEGTWEWAHPTLLRLPWASPTEAWSSAQAHRSAMSLLPREGFWIVPRDLQHLLKTTSEEDTIHDAVEAGPSDEGVAEATTEVRQETAASSIITNSEHGSSASSITSDAVPQPSVSAAVVAMPQRSPRRCRVYDSPIRPAQPDPQPLVPSTPSVPRASQPVGDGMPSVQLPDAHTATVVNTRTGPMVHVAPSSSDISVLQQAPSSGYAATASTAYKPREDEAGNLVVDDHLLVLTLQWAEQLGEDAQGVPITRFRRALDLPTKAHSYQLRDALEQRGLIRREVRDGWYRLVTIRDAVLSGKLPPGPWYVPSAPDDHAEAPAPPAPSSGEEPSEPSVEGDMHPNGANGASVRVALDQSVPVLRTDALEELV